jgi:hypothetical protein
MSSRLKFVNVVVLLIVLVRCTNHVETEVVDCEANKPSVTVESTTDPTTCDSNDGSIVVAGTGGSESYQYSLNGGTYQSSTTFAGLGGGTYTITVRDSKGCENVVQGTLVIKSTDLAATYEITEDSECLTNNGTITVNATGTNTPFEFSIGSGSFSSTNTFTDLHYGAYTVRVRDSQGCTISLSISVVRGQTGVSWTGDIKPIIDANCAISGCHVSGNQIPDWSNLTNVQNNATNIKTRTSNGSMPPASQPRLTQEQITKIACWVDDGAKSD